MTDQELCKIALDFLNVTTCYLKGFWFQSITPSEFDRVANMYPVNKTYGNAKYINTDCYAADCICAIKAFLGGARVGKRISYNEMAHNPVGDCTNKQFMQKLYDCCEPQNAPAGYGLATESHAAISLGNGRYFDFNYGNGQNGAAVHDTGIEKFTKAGKIPGVEYTTDNERDILMKFVTYLVDNYLKNK